MGSILGFTSGFALKKISSGAAVIFGGLFAIQQGLAYAGYVNVNWKKVEADLTTLLDVNKDGKIDEKDYGVAYKKVLEVLQYNGAGCGGGFTAFCMASRRGECLFTSFFESKDLA